MQQEEQLSIGCPYCGQLQDIIVDRTAGSYQFTEECEVCCRPMVVTVRKGENGVLAVEVRQEDD